MRFCVTDCGDRPSRRATSRAGSVPGRAMPSAVQRLPAGLGGGQTTVAVQLARVYQLTR